METTSSSIARATKSPSPVTSILKKAILIPEMGALIPFLAVMAAASVVDPIMISPTNLSVMMRAMAFTGIVAVGMTFLMIGGEIDLSVGPVATLAAVLSAFLMVNKDWAIAPALLISFMVGVLAGLINGLIVVKVGLSSFITTLGMNFIAFGTSMAICNGREIPGVPETLKRIGAATPLGASWPFITFIALVLLGDFVLRRTTLGAMVRATGGNKRAARIAGINTDLVKITCFVLTGALAALAGLFTMATFGNGDPYIGYSWMLTVIAVVIMGGVSLFGGVGSVLGTMLGAFLIQSIRSSLVMIEVHHNAQNVVIGAFLVLAAVLDVIRRRTRTY